MKSIQFQNSLEDLRDYYNYWVSSTPDGQKWVRRVFIYAHTIYIVGALLIWGIWDNFWIAFGFWFLFVLILLLRAKFHPMRRIAQRSIQNWLKFVKEDELENFELPRDLEISDNMLSVRTQEENHSYSWKRVKKVERQNNNIFIHCGSRTVYIVPRRAFGSDVEYKEIYETLHSNLRNHSKVEFPHPGDIFVD